MKIYLETVESRKIFKNRCIFLSFFSLRNRVTIEIEIRNIKESNVATTLLPNIFTRRTETGGGEKRTREACSNVSRLTVPRVQFRQAGLD